MLSSAINDVLHLFFPHICAGCGSDVLDKQHQLCLKCITDLPSTHFFHQKDNPVEQKFYGRLPVRHAGAAFFFTKDSLLETLIYALKYRGNKDIGYYLGEMMGHLLKENTLYDGVEVLVPLPLNKKRERKRGFNQAKVLCEGIAAVTGLSIVDRAVVRNIYTETQTHKERISRWENIDGAFGITDQKLLTGKHALLVDDVVTTGATLEACGAEIMKVPDVILSIATLAYTV